MGSDEAGEGDVAETDGTEGVEEVGVGGVGVEGGDDAAHEGTQELNFVFDFEGGEFVEVGDFLLGEVGGVEAVFEGVAIAEGSSSFLFVD